VRRLQLGEVVLGKLVGDVHVVAAQEEVDWHVEVQRILPEVEVLKLRIHDLERIHLPGWTEGQPADLVRVRTTA
jgi:hypothetical protein